MPKRRTPNRTTSPKVAKEAAKQLADPKSTKEEKSVAGSALGQAKKPRRSS